MRSDGWLFDSTVVVQALLECELVTGFPFGVQIHETIKHLHSGALIGLSARKMDLVAGLSLIFLCVSGLLVYFQL